MKHVNVSVKISVCAKKIIVRILAHVGKYLKSIADTSVIACDKIIYVMDIASTNVANTIATNESTNSDGKKVRYKIDCYIFHSFISDYITIDNYYYLLSLAKHRSKLKKFCPASNIKMVNNEFQKNHIKNRICYYFDNIIKFEGSNCDKTLIDEKSHENILIYDISYKTLIGAKPLGIRFNIIDGFIRIYDRNRYIKLLGSKKYDDIYNRIRYLRNLQ